MDFVRSLTGLLWTAPCEDADRFFVEQRRTGLSVSTRATKAGMLAQFYDFVIDRYQGDINTLTGFVVDQPLGGYNRPAGPMTGQVRAPPSEDEVETLFTHWRATVPTAR
ncbi:hypothetical protein F9B16_09050 [Actinomadura montaniterrae]|uniref:Core-binding (CB) domain-containing protein n=1 Tax=Actinomadura montaniterrae TaxID=1803903 RepID=A0A6L3VXM3_9ACTN|nr:hypothetical protein F9B16_09050 [Actinomadura montaniterrae]